MLSGEIISEDVFTASNAEAGICFSSSSSALGQRRSAVPWKYQGVPLSASTRPYVFIARSTALVSRRSDAAMFGGFEDETGLRRGVASGCHFTVRALAYILVGHEIHHRRVLRERYLTPAGKPPPGA